MGKNIPGFDDPVALESVAAALHERLIQSFQVKDYQRYCLVYWAVRELGLEERVPMEPLPVEDMLSQLKSLYSNEQYGEYCIFAMTLSAVCPRVPIEEWLRKESFLQKWYQLMRDQLVWRAEPASTMHLFLLTVSMIRLFGFVRDPLTTTQVDRTIQALAQEDVFFQTPELAIIFRICVSHLRRHGRLLIPE